MVEREENELMQENDAITSKANVKANNVVKPKFVLASTVLVASFFVIVMLGGYALYAANAISEDKDRMAAFTYNDTKKTKNECKGNWSKKNRFINQNRGFH